MTSLPLVFDAPKTALPPRHLADLAPAERRAAVVELGEQPFRADQLSRHYFQRLENQPAQMTDLPAASRDRLGPALFPPLLTEVRHVETDRGTTRKTLWKLHDGTLVESVLMRYRDRLTVCISSQAGCGMACPFCATGQGGLRRNLSTAEIVEQAVAAARVAAAGELPGGPVRLSNVVFMGMGEPLANYRRVAGALHRLVDPAPAGLGLAQRSVTMSTVGLVPAIRRLAERGVAGHPGGVAARAGRRAARHPGAGEHPVEDPGGAGGRRRLRGPDRTPVLHRIRHDPRRERPALAGRPARPVAVRPAGAREPDPAQPDARARSGTPRPSRSRRHSCSG